MLSKLGTKYDWSMIGWIFWAKVFKGASTENNDDDMLICTELCDYVYNYQIGKGTVSTPRTFYESEEFDIIKE